MVPRSPLSAGYLNDLYSFDPTNMTWTLLSAATLAWTLDAAGRPSARYLHGFISAGGRLYVYGGEAIYEGGAVMSVLREGETMEKEIVGGMDLEIKTECLGITGGWRG